VLNCGDQVVATARDLEKVRDLQDSYPDTAHALALDVTDHEQVARVTLQAEARFGGINVLVNNAGYGYRSALEEGDEAEVQRLFATNFFGPVAMIKAVLPAMRARREGVIVNISSIGARISSAGSGYYVATKAALEAMTASLQKEVAPLGITTICVEPGAFRTDFAGRSLRQSENPIGDYADTAGRRRKGNTHTADGREPGDPAKAAEVIIAAVRAPDSPLLLLLGEDAVQGFRGVLRAQLTEVDAWEQTSLSTGFSS
jgi:NAD(P)-dependent dehydrogenase (short-subunit alcohol dehydrogenase family)